MAAIPPPVPLWWWEQAEDPPGYRWEIIEGELVVTPRESRAHQRAVLALAGVLSAACPAGYEVLADVEWRESDDLTIHCSHRPDLMVVPAGDADPVMAAPLLAVEVLSAFDDQDLNFFNDTKFDVKAQSYRRLGLEHFLVVQPRLRVVFLLSLEDGRWAEAGRAIRDELLEAERPFSFSVRPNALVA